MTGSPVATSTTWALMRSNGPGWFSPPIMEARNTRWRAVRAQPVQQWAPITLVVCAARLVGDGQDGDLA